MIVNKYQAKKSKQEKRKSHVSKGRFGEKIAQIYLQKKGHSLIQSNYSIRGGEIDLIMEKNGIIVFVEVKLRNSVNFGTGLEAINGRKKQKLLRAIFNFLDGGSTGQRVNKPWQLDVIDISYKKSSNTAEVLHIQNILEL